ncbi:glycosyltransferase [Legionella tucsonensis]|uniref:Glycosyl transferases group 1 n=1 Tax=Legionella tucsonensis TaxID=40335 RepID=A0A0W0ZSR6_9GAMM|nr:glycosyltransferase [Legionella tucsonensis]KTD72245.1 Glycosyl transferases group 1 [Legionella tucsonensis]
MNKGTIIYYSVARFPDKNAAAQRVIANAKILRSLGYEVILVGFTTIKEEEGLSVFFEFDCYLLFYPHDKKSWFSYLIGNQKLFDIFEAYQSSLKAVIFYNFPSLAQYRIMKKSRRLKIKCISDITEWYDSSSGSYLFRFLKWYDSSLRIYRVAQSSDGIITTSAFMTDFYLQRTSKVVQIPTLYDCHNLKLIEIDDSAQGNSSLRKFVYCGTPFDPKRVNKNKSNLKDRLDLVILLFNKLFQEEKEFVLQIYGITKSEYLEVFSEHKLILESLKDKIFFNGIVPHTEVIKALQEADFSIFFKENNRINDAGFPSKLAESITYGTPVIINKTNGLKRYDGIEGIIFLNNAHNSVKLNDIWLWTKNDIRNMKKKVLNSKLFHYENYSSQVGDFLNSIGLE